MTDERTQDRDNAYAITLEENRTLRARVAELEAERETWRREALERGRSIVSLNVRVAELDAALRRVRDRQQETLADLRSHGIVFDRAPNGDLSDWQHIAFLIYTDLCEAESIARTALAKPAQDASAEEGGNWDYRLWTNPERTILVTMWESGDVTVAHREHASHTWGPPVTVTEESH